MFTIRKALFEDVPRLQALIARSVNGLQAADYSEAQREAALGTLLGVDTALIGDGTYFVVMAEGEIAACGGWSKRKTLFGADARPDRDDDWLDAAFDAAKIRAFFVEPVWARKGIGTMLLKACEEAARECGFRRYELGATLTGVPLYAKHGYVEMERIEAPLRDGLTLPVVKMVKVC